MDTNDGITAPAGDGAQVHQLTPRGQQHPRVPGLPGGAMEAFRLQLGDLWPHVETRCRALDDDAAHELVGRLRRHLADQPEGAQRARELANDLTALMAGWVHLDLEGRAVLVGAMDYLLTTDDLVPDDAEGGLDDDDQVVAAAVRAVLRTRSRTA